MRAMGNFTGKFLVGMKCIFILTVFVFLQGCASIISGKTQQVTFNSEPSGATVIITGRQIGKTPVTAQLDRAKDQTLIFEKEGYKPVTMQLTTTLNSWFWGNILFLYGGPIGSTVDGITGSVYEYAPSQYFIPLAPVEEKISNIEINKKIFIMMNYDQLVKEIFSVKGEYTETLFVMMGVGKEKESDYLIKLRNMAMTTDNGLVFAEKVVTMSIN
jgi:uncharacterized protein YceK